MTRQYVGNYPKYHQEIITQRQNTAAWHSTASGEGQNLAEDPVFSTSPETSCQKLFIHKFIHKSIHFSFPQIRRSKSTRTSAWPAVECFLMSSLRAPSVQPLPSALLSKSAVSTTPSIQSICAVFLQVLLVQPNLSNLYVLFFHPSHWNNLYIISLVSKPYQSWFFSPKNYGIAPKFAPK